MSSKKAEYSLEQNVNILHPKAVELEGWFRIYGLHFIYGSGCIQNNLRVCMD